MDSTTIIDSADIETLASRLSVLDGVLDESEKVTLLTVFALAAEALEARIDDKVDVGGFAVDAFNVGIQVGVPSTLPGLGDGLLGTVGKAGGKGKGKGGGQQQYLVVTMSDVMITSY